MRNKQSDAEKEEIHSYKPLFENGYLEIWKFHSIFNMHPILSDIQGKIKTMNRKYKELGPILVKIRLDSKNHL